MDSGAINYQVGTRAGWDFPLQLPPPPPLPTPRTLQATLPTHFPHAYKRGTSRTLTSTPAPDTPSRQLPPSRPQPRCRAWAGLYTSARLAYLPRAVTGFMGRTATRTHGAKHLSSTTPHRLRDTLHGEKHSGSCGMTYTFMPSGHTFRTALPCIFLHLPLVCLLWVVYTQHGGDTGPWCNYVCSWQLDIAFCLFILQTICVSWKKSCWPQIDTVPVVFKHATCSHFLTLVVPPWGGGGGCVLLHRSVHNGS